MSPPPRTPPDGNRPPEPRAARPGRHAVHSQRMLIVAGIRLSRDEALALSSMLTRDGFDRTARAVLEALTNSEQFVALTLDDREDILAALSRRTTVLVELRRALFDELNWRREGLMPPRRPRGIEAVISRRDRERVNVAWV